MHFLWWAIKQQICYSFTLIISYMVFNPFKRWSSSSFPNSIVQMLFFQIQQAPGPDFRKVHVGNSLQCVIKKDAVCLLDLQLRSLLIPGTLYRKNKFPSCSVFCFFILFIMV